MLHVLCVSFFFIALFGFVSVRLKLTFFFYFPAQDEEEKAKLREKKLKEKEEKERKEKEKREQKEREKAEKAAAAAASAAAAAAASGVNGETGVGYAVVGKTWLDSLIHYSEVRLQCLNWNMAYRMKHFQEIRISRNFLVLKRKRIIVLKF